MNPDTAHYAYWVQTLDSIGCIQKTYYDIGSLNVKVIETMDGNLLSVYPNPANALVNIQINDLNVENGRLELYNIVGQQLKSTASINNKGTFDISNLPQGTYMVVYFTNNIKKAEALFIKN